MSDSEKDVGHRENTEIIWRDTKSSLQRPQKERQTEHHHSKAQQPNKPDYGAAGQCPSTLVRPSEYDRCAALACKQLNGPHTFSALASALNEVHCEFNIRDKITRTTTDNGSNFIKAFKLYGQTDENNNPGPSVESAEAEDDNGDGNDEEQESEGMEFVEAGAILDEDDCLEYQLPRHHRCACHLLNLVSAVDVEEANVNSAYKRVSRSAFSKCWGLWNKSARSTTAAEVIEKNCKLQLLRPNATRWNSLFLAVERIIRITREQGEGAITAVCSALKIAMFTPVELAFLAEYMKTMAPVAKALDVLQGDTNVQMGWLVPTITILKNKLQNLRLATKFCRPLIDALLKCLEKRFEHVLTEPELIAAAILVPKFKTSWTNDDYTLRLGLDYIKSHLKDQAEDNQADSLPSSSSEEDFFSSIKQPSSQEKAKQLETYLGSPGSSFTEGLFYKSVHYEDSPPRSSISRSSSTPTASRSYIPFGFSHCSAVTGPGQLQ
ncbi:uncharacterized protein LOC117520587 [Thalassophryne amazonica]|uniref:uncharacterized protein LOC117520587 n=1 Tax=Thalassophryne amazonica TaxID=390379 RepID=UPI001471C6F2|nr:uncharacterized protein LOC117520587 [Thalassophryne amazonica]